MYGFQRLKKIFKGGVGTKEFKQLATVSVVVAVAFVLYVVGIKPLLLPVLIVINAWILPLPRIFASWVGRLVASFLLVMALLQIGASLQFLAFPKRGFVTLAIFLGVLQLAIWLIAPQKTNRKIPIISVNDLCAVLVIVGFLLPFSSILVGHNSMQRITEVGTYQAVDAINHYDYIAVLTQAQHLNYTVGNVAYPSGFHIAVSFIQDTLFSSQYSLGWRNNVVLFFGDYLIYGSLLGYILYLLCLDWLRLLKGGSILEGWDWRKLLLALCLMPPAVLLYLLPFVHEGFLNYYYVCTTIFIGLIFLGEITSGASGDSINLARDVYGHWWLFVFLLLVFGASASWPLLIPPLVVTGVLFLLPDHSKLGPFFKKVWTWRATPLYIAFALQLIPIYFQLKYGDAQGPHGLNATGSITSFHPFILLAGLFLLAGMLTVGKQTAAYRRLLINTFMPLFVFFAVLLIYQEFSVGDVRYYAIKVSVLLEILLLILGVAALVSAFGSSKFYSFKYAWWLPFFPILAVLLLMSMNSNPLKDARALFPSHFGDVPPFLGQDIQNLISLGLENKIEHDNVVSLHYNVSQNKFFSDMQAPYWANAMQYNPGEKDSPQEQKCIGQIYMNLTFRPKGPDQSLLIRQLRSCAAAAKQHGETFYIVTDLSSAPYVRNSLSNSVKLVY